MEAILNIFMDFRDWLIAEMPIEKMDFKGDWSPGAKRKYRFRDIDARLLGNEKARGKICHMWRHMPQKINMCFVRSKYAYKYRQEGQVSEEWVKENLKEDIKADPDAITVIYTGNEDKPLTGWILAHRLAHTIRNTYEFSLFNNELLKAMREILDRVYKIPSKLSVGYGGRHDYGIDQKYAPQFTALSKAIGTMRSAREGSLLRVEEFVHEIVAQYIIQGKNFEQSLLRNGSIKFNKLPQELTWGRKAWGKPINARSANPEEKEEMDANLEELLPELLEYYLSELFSSLEGKIFVM